MTGTETSNSTTTAPREAAVEYVHTAAVPAFFANERISLITSTYQAQRIMTLAPNGPKLTMLMRVIPRPTGLVLNEQRMVVCSKNQVWFFERVNNLRDEQGAPLPYDRVYAPRAAHVTGDILGHELALLGGKLIIINTRFSCICELDPGSSFKPIWQPKFISALAAEDRCHLNGLAHDGQQIRYVTALGVTDVKDGWRPGKASGGVLIDYASREVIADGFSMPHSPRLYRGQLWLLESGTGSLMTVDPQSGKRTVCRQFSGYTRGLAFHKHYAFVGLSQIREKDLFGGLPIESAHPQLNCGITIVDLNTMKEVGMIQFTKGIEELFDIHVMTGITSPHVIGFEEDTINGLYVLP